MPGEVESRRTLRTRADAMAKGGFRHLVVVEDGELAGIISMRDLIQVWRPGGAGARSSA